MNYSAAAKAQLAGTTVRMEFLVEFRFASETIRVWNGFGSLKTLDDHMWDGIANVGEISGLSQSLNGAAPALVLSVSGVDSDFAAKAKAESDEYINRAVVVYLQFFGGDDDDWACLDNPYPLTLARMSNVTSTMATGDDGTKSYTVSILAETPFATRRRPKFGYFTDRDQQLRYPGDRGLERVAGIDSKNITFPDF